MGKKVLITGGTGLIGKELTKQLLAKGYEVSLLSRDKSAIPGVTVYQWDVGRGYIEDGALDNVHFLVHLAGTNVGEGRWTKARKQSIIESRTKTIELIASKLTGKTGLPKAFVSASGSNYYGADTGEIMNTEQTPEGTGFLAAVSGEWERAADEIAKLGIRTVKLRTGVVLSADGGALKTIAMPARFGVGAPLGTGKQWMSWIHLDDICRLHIAALENESWHGVYNAVTEEPVRNTTLTKAICRQLHRPQWLPPVPAFLLKLALGEMAGMVLGSNRVINQRIAEETDFQYKFPELEAALSDTLG